MRLNDKFKKEILPKLASETGLNVFSLPQISKTTITVGLGPFREKKDVLEAIERELTLITSQKPKTSVAKKSISGFKLREGQLIGYQVTLRGKRMWDFIDKLVKVVLPRIRSFDGIDDKSFDKSSNLTISVREQIVFPEITHDEVKESWGMGITFTLNKPCDQKMAKKLFTLMGFIFKQD